MTPALERAQHKDADHREATEQHGRRRPADRGGEAMGAEARPGFRVVCVKPSGTRALFKTYGPDELGQARIDRDALQGLGINAVLEGGPASAGDAQGSEATR
jgi:hypothetical protein